MPDKRIETEEELVGFIHGEIGRLGGHGKPAANVAVAGGVLALAEGTEQVAAVTVDAVALGEDLRARYTLAIEIWRECIKDIRAARMASVGELMAMEKSMDRLTGKLVHVDALTSAIKRLSAALQDPALERVLK